MNFKYKNGDLESLVAKRSKLEETLIQEEPEHVKTNQIINKTSETSSSQRKRLSSAEKDEIIVIEDQDGFVENQIKMHCFNDINCKIYGKYKYA